VGDRPGRTSSELIGPFTFSRVFFFFFGFFPSFSFFSADFPALDIFGLKGSFFSDLD